MSGFLTSHNVEWVGLGSVVLVCLFGGLSGVIEVGNINILIRDFVTVSCQPSSGIWGGVKLYW
jgi:hypothetical protein